MPKKINLSKMPRPNWVDGVALVVIVLTVLKLKKMKRG